MKYTKFVINDYKWIKWKLELDLIRKPEGNIFTLVWLNESWKTSILEAINILQNRISDTNAHKLIHKSKKWNFSWEIYVECSLILDEEDELRIKEFCKNNINFNLTQNIEKITIKKSYKFKNSKFEDYNSLWTLPINWKILKWKKEVALHSHDKSSWSKVVNYIEERFPKILYYENFLFDFPQKIYLESFEWETKEQIEYRKVFQDILDSFNDNLTIKEHFIDRLNNNTTENKESLESLEWMISSKLTNEIFKNWEHIFTKSNKEIEIQIQKDESGKYYVELKIKQWRDRFHINERSLWFRWFFSFLLFTEFRKARKDDFWETLFLLDEPASNLHQKSQQKLLELFEKLSSKSKIIYSTHSHHLINPKYLNGTYIIKNNAINYDNEENFDQNETEIKTYLYKQFVSKYPNEEDHFKPILDSIEYSPSQLEMVPKIVCLEWKNDYYTLKYFYNKLNIKNEIHFYPWASVTKYENLFRLYLSWNKVFIALFDWDKQWIESQKDYIKNISIELNNKIFTLKDIDMTWNFELEKLFTEEDKILVIQLCFPEIKIYNKSKFNTWLQDLYINNKEISFSKITLDNFQKIFDFLITKI